MENPENNNTDIKSNESKMSVSLEKDLKTKDAFIKIGFLLLSAFFAGLIIVLFLYYGKDYGEALKNSPELILVSIILFIRFGILSIFSILMFRKWFTLEKKYFKNIPFLVGLFFYLMLIGKIFDLIIYIYYESPDFNEESFLFLVKIRYFFVIIYYLPLLFLGLRPVIYNFGLKRGWDEKKVLKVRREIIALYVAVFGFLIIVLPILNLLFLNFAILSILSYILIWYIFRFAHKHNTFPTIRANYVSWGFFLYLISSATRVILSTFFSEILSIGQITIIAELSDFFIILIIFYGFFMKKTIID